MVQRLRMDGQNYIWEDVPEEKPLTLIEQIQQSMGPRTGFTSMDEVSSYGGTGGGMYQGDGYLVLHGKIYPHPGEFNHSGAAIPAEVRAAFPMASREEWQDVMIPKQDSGIMGMVDRMMPTTTAGAFKLFGSLGMGAAGIGVGNLLSSAAQTGGSMFNDLFSFFEAVNGTPTEVLASGGMPDFHAWSGVDEAYGAASDASWNVNARGPWDGVDEMYGNSSGGPWDGIDEAYGEGGYSVQNPNATGDYTQDMNQVGGNGPLANPDYSGSTNGGVFNPGSAPGAGFMDTLMKYGPRAAFEAAKSGLFGDSIRNMTGGSNGAGLLDGLLSGKLAPAALGALLGAMGSKDPQTATTTDTSTVTQTGLGEAQPYIQKSMADASAWGDSPLPYASADEMVAPMNEYQRHAMATTRDLTEGSVVPGLQNTWTNVGKMGDGRLMDVNANPYLQAAIQAAIRPVTRTYEEKVLPGVRSTFNMGADENNSRQGVAEGIATRGYMDTIADTAATMSNRGYETGMQATLSALGQVPNLTQASMVPGNNMMTMGTQQQNTEQAQRDAKAKYDALKWQRISAPAGLFNNASNTGKVTSSTGSKSVTRPAGNPMLGAVGGALTGAQIYQMLYGK